MAPDWDAFRRYVVLKRDWSPVTVDKTIAHLTFLRDEHGLDLEDFTEPKGEEVLFRRVERGATTWAFNTDVKALNAYACWRFNVRRGPYLKRRNPRKQPTSRSWTEIRRLLAYAHRDPLEQLRGRALVHFLLGAVPLRPSENARQRRSWLVDLDGEDYVHVGAPAKRGFIRDVWVSPELRSPKRPFGAYLARAPVPPEDPDALWVGVGGSWHAKVPRRLTANGLRQQLWRVSTATGVPFNANVARKTWNTMAARAGLAGEFRSAVLGHPPMSTEGRYYLDLSREDLARALKGSPLPSLFSSGPSRKERG